MDVMITYHGTVMGRTVPWITSYKNVGVRDTRQNMAPQTRCLQTTEIPSLGVLEARGQGSSRATSPRGGLRPGPFLWVVAGCLAPLGSDRLTPISASAFASPSLCLSSPRPPKPPSASVQGDGHSALDAGPTLMILSSKFVVTPAKMLFLNLVTCTVSGGLRYLSSGGPCFSGAEDSAWRRVGPRGVGAAAVR